MDGPYRTAYGAGGFGQYGVRYDSIFLDIKHQYGPYSYRTAPFYGSYCRTVPYCTVRCGTDAVSTVRYGIGWVSTERSAIRAAVADLLYKLWH